MHFNVFSFIGSVYMIQGLDVASRLEFDHLARPDLDRQKSVGTATDIVGGDHANGIHHPYVAVQAEDLFPAVANEELAVLFDGIALARKSDTIHILARLVWRMFLPHK